MDRSVSMAFPRVNWKDWEGSGQNEFLRQCKSHVFHLLECPGDVTANAATAALGQLMEALLLEVVGCQIKSEAVVPVLVQLVGYCPLLREILVDAISVVECKISLTEDKDQKSRLIAFLNESQSVFGDDKRLLKERLDMDLLQELEVVRGNTFNTKLIKIKTRLFYKQQKFNLLREESEGYSKLITELNQDFADVPTEHLLEILKSLIGCFNLDPNRVLDIILESFESRPSEGRGTFVPLLRAFNYDQVTLAEVLGSKFVNAASGGDAGLIEEGKGGHTPKSLYVLAALMLHYKLVQLDDLLKWLIPYDEMIQSEAAREMNSAMEAYRRTQVVSLQQDGVPTREEEKLAEETRLEKMSSNQKLCLLEAVLTVGDVDLSLQLFNRLPDAYPASFPGISRAICRLIHALTLPLYQTAQCSSSALNPAEAPPSASFLFSSSLSAPVEECADGRPRTAMPFLLPIQEVKDVYDMKLHCFPLLNALGPFLSVDVPLMYKLLRIMSAYFEKNPFQYGADVSQTSVQFDILTALDLAILPGVSLLESHCGLGGELWTLFQRFPYHVRYHLFGSWKNESWRHHPVLVRKQAENVKTIKAIMKRVSKENVKQLGRTIGKLAHSSPGIIFDYILMQIQMYDNMISPVADMLRYLTSFSYDILGYCIIEALANPEKDRVKHDGTTISLWLQSLATLCGYLNKKYPMDLTGLLQYVANQLKAHKSLDLILIKELVTKMGGIEATDEMTDDQLHALAGGELLRQEAGSFAQMRNMRKSSSRLRDALCNANLAVPLCLLMAQQRACVIHEETAGQGHLKLVGKLFDQCQDTLIQLGTFLSLSMNTEEYISRIPSLGELLSGFHIEADTAFFLVRPKYWSFINNEFLALQASKTYATLSEAEKKHRFINIMNEVLGPLQEDVKKIHAPKVWQEISPALFVAFWTLSLHELMVPETVYEREIEKLKAQMKEAEDKRDLPSGKRRREVDRCQGMIEKLRDEMKKQKEQIERVHAYMEAEKERWFPPRQTKNEAVTNVLQLCIFPRTLYTNVDAIYCAKFIQMLHSLRTANFSSLICLDKIFCDISYTVTSCTENEAHRYGRFLSEILGMCSHWHSDKAVYEKECGNHPGFVTRVRGPSVPSHQDKPVELNYDAYMQVAHKWHYKLTKALVVCLESKDYVSIRNALLVLKKILPHFPTIESLGNIIERRISTVQQQEKNARQDLYILATSYKGLLQAQKVRMKPDTDYQRRWMKAASQGLAVHPLVKPPARSAATTLEKKVTPDASTGQDSAAAKTATAKALKTQNVGPAANPPVKVAASSILPKDTKRKGDSKKKKIESSTSDVGSATSSPVGSKKKSDTKRSRDEQTLAEASGMEDSGYAAEEKRRRTEATKGSREAVDGSSVQELSDEHVATRKEKRIKAKKIDKEERKRERIRPPSDSPSRGSPRSATPPAEVAKRRREERFRSPPPSRERDSGAAWHSNGAPTPAPMEEYYAFRERLDRDFSREFPPWDRGNKEHWERSPERSRERPRDKISRRTASDRDKW